MARGRSQRMAMAWQGAFNTAGISLSTTQSSMLQTSESTLKQTLLRTRGNILVQATPNASTDLAVAAFGLIVVNESAATVGGASLPGPINDVDADWLWHQFVPLDAITLTAADPNARSVVHRLEIDAKAMRKVGPDKVVVLMAELGGSAFSAVTAIAGARFLLGHG